MPIESRVPRVTQVKKTHIFFVLFVLVQTMCEIYSEIDKAVSMVKESE